MKSETMLHAASNIIAGGIGVFVGLAIAGENCGADEWLFRWQTLIAGVLAVGAAAITVLQMQRTDERQQKRHDELTRVSLRSDRLKVTRARDKANYSLRLAGENLPGLIASIANAAAAEEEARDREANNAIVDDFRFHVEDLSRCLADPLFVDAEPLFSATLTIKVQSLQDINEEGVRYVGAIRQIIGVSKANFFHADPEGHLNRLLPSLAAAADLSRNIADELDALVEAYE